MKKNNNAEIGIIENRNYFKRRMRLYSSIDLQ